MRAVRFRAAMAFAAVLAAALPVSAQTSAPAAPPAAAAQEPSSIFGEQIDVRVVNVEAVVVDKQGNRVTGLRPEDFRLRVDGQETPIEYFTEVRGGQAVAPGEGGAASGADERALPGLPALAPGTPVGTSYLVFIDDYFSIDSRRDEVLRKLKGDLGRLGPEDRMAIVAFDGRKVEMLSTWSNAERTLSRALDEAMLRPAYGFQRLAELRHFQSRSDIGTFATDRRFSNRLELDELAYIQTVGAQVQRSVAASVAALRGFAQPPGRKVMLLFSGGWPFSPADYVLNDPGNPVLTREVPRGEDLLRPLADTANLLGYTIYAVDVPGVEAQGPDASMGSPRTVGLNLREHEIHASLEYVARQTGGRALLNGLRADALQTAASDTRSYYWLGFTPTRQRNDERHDVRIEVTRPGLEVRTRNSFLDLSRKTEVSMMVESAMLFGTPPGSAAMPIEIGRPEKAGRREMVVPVALAIPMNAISMVPYEGKQVAELELRVAALDDNGNRAEVPVIPIRLSADEVPPANSYVRYDTKLRLRRMKHHLVLAVFDPVSGKISTAEVDVKP